MQDCGGRRLGLRVLGFKLRGSGLRFQGVRCGVWDLDLGFWVWGLGIWCLWVVVHGLVLRV